MIIPVVSVIVFMLGAVAVSVFFLWVICAFASHGVEMMSASISKMVSYPKHWRFYRLLFEHKKDIRNLTAEEEKKLSSFLSDLFRK
jgi:membrane protein implicated in regulation of membrane protease activity